MKNLLTIMVCTFLCLVSKAQQNVSIDIDANTPTDETHCNADLNFMVSLIKLSDAKVDSFMLEKHWEYFSDTVYKKIRWHSLEYSYLSDGKGHAVGYTTLLIDSVSRIRCVEVMYFNSPGLFNSISKQLRQSGFINIKTYRERDNTSNTYQKNGYIATTCSYNNGCTIRNEKGDTEQVHSYIISLLDTGWYVTWQAQIQKKTAVNTVKPNKWDVAKIANWTYTHNIALFAIPLSLCVLIWGFRKKYLYDKWVRENGKNNTNNKNDGTNSV